MPHTDEGVEGEPWTFATTSNGDIQMTDQNTVRTVHGEQCTVQSLKVALATYQGTDPRDEEFGLDVFGGALNSFTALKREIRRTLEYDDYRHNRVTSIRSVELSGHRDGSRQNINVHVTLSLTEQPDDITLIFDLFDGSLRLLGQGI